MTKQKVTILLRLSPQCLQAVASKKTAFEIWTELSTVFRVQGPSQIYADFKQATSHRVRLNDPAPDLLEIACALVVSRQPLSSYLPLSKR